MKLPMPFEKWTTYEGHSGVDFPYARNTPIRASGNGVVTRISYSDTGGWRVWVDYGEGRIIKYVHMDARDKIVVSVGERVSYGQVIAYVGSLGLSTGPHLHIENGLKAGFDYVWDIVDKNTWIGKTSIPELDKDDDMFNDNDRQALSAILTAATQAASRAADGEARNFSRVFLHEEGDYREWNFPAEWLPPLEGSPGVDGYRVTTDESEARRWHMASSVQRFARSSFRPVTVTKDEKHALQAQWRQNARDWRAAVALAVKDTPAK